MQLRVGALDLPEYEKGCAAAGLVALTDPSKHDLARASARLDLFLADLDAGLTPRDEVD